jgi:hypothetical protein
MKVKELIETLGKYKEDAEVMYWDAEESRHYPPTISIAYKNTNKNNEKIIEIDRYC